MVKRIGSSGPATLVGIILWLSWSLKLSTPELQYTTGVCNLHPRAKCSTTKWIFMPVTVLVSLCETKAWPAVESA